MPRQRIHVQLDGLVAVHAVRAVWTALGAVPGVLKASVNAASEKAHVLAIGGVTEAALRQAVEAAGYELRSSTADAGEEAAARALAAERRDVVLAGIFSAPFLIGMIGMGFGQDWMPSGWAQFGLASFVEFWLGARFWRAGFKALRAGAANMDVLVALGTGAAWALSTWLLLSAPAHHGTPHLYIEAAAVVIFFVLLGKYLEARAKRATGAAIRASVRSVEHELVFAVLLVVLVTFVFLRNVAATIIPSIAVPLSLIGTFGVMYLAGYSLNILTLMALTVATGFVVDDAIVMLENIARYREEGDGPMEAALKGAAQIGFTLVSLTISLIAVLIPLLFMGDVVGRLFREFAITLAVAILISAVVSLTLTPMMCARLLRAGNPQSGGAFARYTSQKIEALIASYARLLQVVFKHQTLTLFVALGTFLLTAALTRFTVRRPVWLFAKYVETSCDRSRAIVPHRA